MSGSLLRLLFGGMLAFALATVFLSLPAVSAAAGSAGGIVVAQSKRRIRLTTHHSRTHTALKLRNDGSGAARDFLFAVHGSQAEHVALVTAAGGAGKANLAVAKEGGVDKKAGQLYRVTLDKPLPAGETVDVKVSTVMTGLQEPHPVEIAQTARQYVRYYDNHYLWSPYTVERQQTEVKLASSAIESHTQAKPTSVKGDTITYGPYDSAMPPYKRSKLAVHFQNNSPFATADAVLKEVEVSHWGNVAITEEYKLVHTGARLKGGFSRIDYNRAPGSSGVNAIVALRGKLPYGAADVYYRDLIGNVSTSRIHGVYPETQIELVPRFPVFGGWRDHFEYGYNLPLANYVSQSASDPSLRVLEFAFSVPFPEVVIRDHTVRVILPEGSTDVTVHEPFEMDSVTHELHHTILDTVGRPTVVLRKSNVVAEHNHIVRVSYRFTSTAMLREPLFLTAAFALFFVACMIYARIDLSISHDQDEGKEKVN